MIPNKKRAEKQLAAKQREKCSVPIKACKLADGGGIWACFFWRVRDFEVGGWRRDKNKKPPG